MDEKTREHCQKCGEHIAAEEMDFCPNCGTKLPLSPRIPTDTAPRPKRRDMFTGISIGVILILLAVTFMRYPINPNRIINYLETMTNLGRFIKPPSTLLDPIIFFLYAAGVWGVILSGLRFGLKRSIRRALGDLIGSLFTLFCAYLISNYADNVLTNISFLAYFIIGIGFVVIGNTLIHLILPKRYSF